MKIITLNLESLKNIDGGNNLGKTGPESQETVNAFRQLGKSIEDAYDFCVGFINGLFS